MLRCGYRCKLLKQYTTFACKHWLSTHRRYAIAFRPWSTTISLQSGKGADFITASEHASQIL
jgi:hypothetical protein